MQIRTNLSDKAILHELGMRLARHRLNKNLTQGELAVEAGIGVATIYRIEKGHSIQLSSLIRVVRILGLITNFDALVPEPPLSPIQQAKLAKAVRRRASRRSESKQPERWKWGNEP
jgi:transcriptional regulator with XRE-family HTH domain